MARHKQFDREAVLDKAMRLFWRQGYEATSIQDLVAATGINRGSMYDTFGDKRRLFVEAIALYARRSSAQALHRIATSPTPLADLRAYFQTVIDFARGDGRALGCLLTNATVELSPRDPEIAAKLNESIGAVEAGFAAAITRAQTLGQIAPTRDPQALAQFLLAVNLGLRVLSRAQARRETLENVVDTALAGLDAPTLPSI